MTFKLITDDYLFSSLNQQQQLGKVFLVGAGPGDPELLTLKAYKIISQAKIIVHDHLVSDEILKLAPPDAQLIKVGKQCGKTSCKQEDINQMLVELAQTGINVCRLKGGDPFVFGRGAEEALFLTQHYINFEVIPGVTAALGCTAYSSIPITHRNVSRGFTVITAHGKDENYQIPWKPLAGLEQTLIFYMGLNKANEISNNLIKNGLNPSTPVAVISKGTTAEHTFFLSTLTNLIADIQKHNPPTPSLIVVGETVSLSHELSGFKSHFIN